MLDGSKIPWRDSWLYEYFWERAFPQTPTVLGVRGDRYKFMRYHGIWDKYELYDLEKDPHEMNNLLGDFIQDDEAGPLDNLIRQRAEGETREVFDMMSKKLSDLLEETRCAPEPNWRPA